MAALFKVGKSPTETSALTNRLTLPPNGGVSTDARHVKVETNDGSFYYFTVEFSSAMKAPEAGFTGPHRKWARLALNDSVNISAATIKDAQHHLGAMTCEIAFFKKTTPSKERYDAAQLARQLSDAFRGQVFQEQQSFIFRFAPASGAEPVMFTCTVTSLHGLSAAGVADVPVRFGVLFGETRIAFTAAEGGGVSLVGAARPTLLDPQWKFEDLGIGGLDEQFRAMFRRAFVSRMLPPEMVENLGLAHVKGILLHGPPGTGKTLIARKIGNMLNGREPKLVKGPEILSKFVGESEENIRKLFADAEAEYKAKGEGSGLHVIIFDEIDAICKARGTVSNGTGVNDSVVNQLLSQIDGVDSLNNILLIGMTNRLDMIDEALLRPGRFELKLMIGLPDEDGRRQIFDIHTKRMRENGLLAPDVDTAVLAARCKNFSGAEIAGLVRAAVSRATEHCIKLSGGVHVDVAAARDIRITMRDFEQALDEVRPAFGADDDQLERHCINGIVSWDTLADTVLDVGHLLVQQVAHSVRSPLVSLLVEGEAGTGKSALACEVAQRSKFPFIKLVSAEKMIGLSEAGKLAVISKTFDDAHKSELACIVVDDIERIVEWVPIGARFSNHLLQALLVLLKKTPPAGHRLLVICTTSCMSVLREMGMTAIFSKIAHVPPIERADQLESILETSLDADTLKQVMASVDASTICRRNGKQRLRIGVKKVFSFMDMARQADDVAGTLLDSLYDECSVMNGSLN